MLADRVAVEGTGIDHMAVDFAVAVVLLSPLAPGAAPAVGSAELAVLAIVVGFASTVVPYVLDQIVVHRIGPGRFALLLALLPATAALTGLVVLGQDPSATETAGIALVIVAVASSSCRDAGERPPAG